MSDFPSPGNVRAPDGVLPFEGDAMRKAIRGWLMFLQGFMKERPAGRYRWHPDPNQTEILIVDQESDITITRPRIVTTRGPYGWVGTSHAQILQQSLESPNKMFTDLLQASVAINVVMREGLEAQNLAYTIMRAIPFFRPQIARVAGLHAIMTNMSISQESPIGQVVSGSAVPEWKKVTLTVPFYLQDTIKVEGEDFYSLMKAVTLNMGL